MDVGDRGGGAAVVVWVVGDVEEADALLQGAGLGDLLVVVGDDGDVHGVAAGQYPVLAQGVAVTGVDGLNGVAQLVHQAHEVAEGPAFGAERLPDLQVVLEGAEGDEGVVRGAATEDLGSRVADVRVAHGLLGGRVVIVELAAEEGQPLAQVEHPIVHEVAGAGLDHEDPLVREVLGQARGDDAAGGASTDDDIVVAVSIGGGDVRGRHCGRGSRVGLSEELTEQV